MSTDLLLAHPDLATRLGPDITRRCPVPVGNYGGGGTRQCSQPARWRVRGYLAQCGIHAASTLRRLLVEAEAGEGGGS